MPLISGVAFDMEGTVIDLEGTHFDAFVRAAAGFGITTSFDEIVTRIPLAIGGGDQLIAEGICCLDGNRVKPVDLRAAKNASFTHMLHTTHIGFRVGFLAVFRALGKMGLPMAVASLTEEVNARFIFKKSGFHKLFGEDLFLLLHDVQNKKPAPDVFLKAAERMRIDPKNMLVFEDSPTGVEAGKAAGAKVIAVPVFHTKDVFKKLIDAGADRIVCDWREMDIKGLLLTLGGE